MLFAKQSTDPYSKPHVLLVVSNTNYANETIVCITQDIRVAIARIRDDIHKQMVNISSQEVGQEEVGLFPDMSQEVLNDYKVCALDVYRKLTERLSGLVDSSNPTKGLADVLFAVNRICADASGEITNNSIFDKQKIKMKHYGVMISELDVDATPEFIHVQRKMVNNK